jgi:hypothetical protein
MSRSGYDDSCNGWDLIRWRGQVASAIKGKRGQTFLKELVDALDRLPAKRLIANDLIKDGEVCAMGAIGLKRNVALEKLDVDDYEGIAEAFGIAHQLVQEIEFINDEPFSYLEKTPEQRWERVKKWATDNIKAKP